MPSKKSRMPTQKSRKQTQTSLRKRNTARHLRGWSKLVQTLCRKKLKFKTRRRSRVRGTGAEQALGALDVMSDIAQSISDPLYAISLITDPEKIKEWGKLFKMQMHEQVYKPPSRIKSYLTASRSRIHF